jgi:photosystem II stability/assembly factor-like uncharacterized protein
LDWTATLRWTLIRTALASTGLALGAVSPSARLVADGTTVPAERLDGRVLGALQWRPLGPARFGGRVTDITGIEDRPGLLYAATASGGLWKTEDLGTTWEPIFDSAGCASIGDVAVAPSNPDVIWVGTGEANSSQNSPWGRGVYRSIDGGRSWTHLGLDETRHIGRVVVHPANPDVAYVAAVGDLWGPNPERGVFQTTDGGRNWQRVLTIDADTGAIDLVMDPADPRVLLAATYQRRRTPWGLERYGRGSGIHRTVDGGRTWTKLGNGLPAGELGRIGLDVYRRDGRLLYAVIEAKGAAGGLYRSVDRGDTWEQLTDLRPWPPSSYFGQVRVDPNDPKRIYVAGRPLSLSDDGGRTFRDTAARGVHSDEHALWIDPANSRFLALGNDGGVYVSFDRSEHWRMLDNLPIGQFYAIAADMQDPYWVCGSLQDNGGWCGPSASRFGGGIGNYDWVNVVGADGFYVAPDPRDPRVLFAEWQEGRIVRVDRVTGERKPIRPAAPPGEEPYRWNFSTPFVLSAQDPAILYLGGNRLFKTTDRGDSWTVISPDVSRSRGLVPGTPSRPSRDEETLGQYGTITTIAESPVRPGLLYVGTDDGALLGSRDDGKTWTDLASGLTGLPRGTYVSRVVSSRHAAGRVFAAFDGHYTADYTPYVYVSDDYGHTWDAISGGLPQWSVNVIVEHPRNPNLLFLGNEAGVYVSADRGASWGPLNNNMPPVPVDDLVIHPRENDLIAGTHGRSVWILEDIAPLEQLSGDVITRAVHLFSVRRATIFNYPPSPLSHRAGIDSGPRYWNSGTYAAPNPPTGARIRYWVRDGLASAVKITVLDASGNAVRELEGPGGAGIHEVTWDLRLPPLPGGAVSPRVLPGAYRVRLEAGGSIETTDLQVRLDPLVRVSPEDLAARQSALMDLRAVAVPLFEGTAACERLARELAAAGARSLAADLGQAVAAATGEVRGIAGVFRAQRPEWSATFTSLDGSHSAPRPDELRSIGSMRRRTGEAVERLNALVTARLPQLASRLAAYGVSIDPGSPVVVETSPSVSGRSR